MDATSNYLVALDSTGTSRTTDFRSPVATTLSTPLNPTGFNRCTAGFMLGLGTTQTITPNSTGRVHATICGVISDGTTVNHDTAIRLYMGSGVAPANKAAITGTAYGADQTQFCITGVTSWPFSVSALVTGLTNGTAYWIDGRVIADSTLVFATCTQVAVSAFEV
jgi:hypothetical protein